MKKKRNISAPKKKRNISAPDIVSLHIYSKNNIVLEGENSK